MHNDETSDFMQLIQTIHIHYCTYAIQATAHGLLIASLFPDCSSSLSAGWNHDEVHAAVWERDVGTRGGDGDRDTGGKNERAWCECVCGWMHMCNTSDLSSSSRSVSSLWFWVERPPPDTRWLERRDLDWKCFTHSLSPAEVSPHEHKVTDVTDLDTSLSVLSRRFGLLTIRVLPTSRELLFNQWNFFFFFSIQNKCMLLQRFWFIFQIFAMGIWP